MLLLFLVLFFSTVLNRPAINEIAHGPHKCQETDGADDMWLGSLSRKIGVPMIHTNSFHQASVPIGINYYEYFLRFD